MNVIFDMETGDPDDLITLIFLLNHPKLNIKGITCYQGSPTQIGLIEHVIGLAKKDYHIPVGGWNTVEPIELSPYYKSVVGHWEPKNATLTPVEVFKQAFEKDHNIHVLTGAPLTNIKLVLEALPHLSIHNMITQGGYLGNIIPEQRQLKKFKKQATCRTYNLGNDTNAFDIVYQSPQIEKITYVTKDLCHGFLYTAEIHKEIKFGSYPLGQLLKSCLEHYASQGKNKAMHDPLAMIYMLYPEIGQPSSIHMKYSYNEKGHPVFSSEFSPAPHRFGLVDYNQEKTWQKFARLCQAPHVRQQLKVKSI